jgi:hypothetical protein
MVRLCAVVDFIDLMREEYGGRELFMKKWVGYGRSR